MGERTQAQWTVVQPPSAVVRTLEAERFAGEDLGHRKVNARPLAGAVTPHAAELVVQTGTAATLQTAAVPLR